MTLPTYRLSPSDLTFLWDECPRCFYLKVVRKFKRPRAPFPSIFSRIDSIMKEHFMGQSAAAIHPSLPAGSVRFGEKWVQSTPIVLAGVGVQVELRGKFDSIAAFDDGSYGVIDFKTSRARPSHLAFYGRQLHAYAYALEHPAQGKFSLSPVTRLGLLVVEPRRMERTSQGEIAYLGQVTWQEISKDEAAFLGFLQQVGQVLAQPEPPAAGDDCSYCQYRQAAREQGL